MAKPVVSAKQFSFEHLMDGWTDEHYIKYRPFTYAEAQEIKGLKENQEQGIDTFAEMIKDHFVSGAWLVSDDGTLENARTEPMTKDNVTELPLEVMNAFITAAMGQGSVSPKPAAN